MSNEKKGKGIFGKIQDTITGNEPEQNQNADNGAVNDAVANQNEEDELKDEEVVTSKEVADPSHLKPQAESDGPPARPVAVDKAHLKPQEEVNEKRKVKVADPSHLKPQE